VAGIDHGDALLDARVPDFFLDLLGEVYDVELSSRLEVEA
jgi:hypothetical protein